MTAYDVDLEDLASVIAAMAACQRSLGDLARDVEAATAHLHEEWEGAACDAHAASYAGWREGFARMVTALAGVRGVGEAARTGYADAQEANVALWEQVG